MLSALEKRIKREYSTAFKGVQKKYDDFVDQFSKDEAEMQARVNAGTITEKEFAQWRIEQVLLSDRWRDMRDVLAKDLTSVDRKVASIINGYTPSAYALNHNFATYEIEKGTSINSSYTIYSRESVERILKNNPKLLPKSKLDIPKDRRWNNQHINSAVTQGILQGESLSEVSDRLQSVTDMDRRAAVRNARTVMTGAQNAGRIDAYRRMKALGIDVKKKWMSTLDHHTRDSHAKLDGETAEIEENFSNGLMYPGDPKGEPSEVYNCRCTMISDFPEYPSTDMERYDNIDGKPIGNVTYSEWERSRPKDTIQSTHKMVDGKDISKTWERRETQYDFEIDDIINAQGFDGLPRIVDEREFDELSKDSNLYAQRVYSSSDEEALKKYQDDLYYGKFYVDCSVGGSAFGQGMYMSGDFTGSKKLDVMVDSDRYVKISEQRGNTHSIIEKLTLDKSAKIITYNELLNEFYSEVDQLQNEITRTVGQKLVEEAVQKHSLSGEDKNFLLWGLHIPKDVEPFDISKAMSYEGDKGRINAIRSQIDAEIRTSKKANAIIRSNGDMGIYGALKGYDAINIENEAANGTSQVLVLNRTKLIIKKER